jgi:hypothetical protein
MIISRLNLKINKFLFFLLTFFLYLTFFSQIACSQSKELDISKIDHASEIAPYSGSPIRLSQWLSQREKLGLSSNNDYFLGLMWITPEEFSLQEKEYEKLKVKLNQLQIHKIWELTPTSRLSKSSIELMHRKRIQAEDEISKLKVLLNELKPTGKVRTAGANARWLEVNPKKDPVIRSGDKVLVPQRPFTIRIMISDGSICEIPHKSGAYAKDYLLACRGELLNPWAWIVEPDGRIIKVGVRPWNSFKQQEPAPGSWIWAPIEQSVIPEEFNKLWVEWLATQGVSSQVTESSLPLFYRQVEPTESFFNSNNYFAFHDERTFNPRTNASDFGYVGIMQTPTARMRQAGSFSTNLQSTKPYVNWNNFFQPLDWLETGFRYTKIANRDYYSGGPDITSGEGYVDKSIDVKVRTSKESDYLPETAIGVRDLAGTGLFSSEYIVASKRLYRFDFSTGIGWGNMGGRGDLASPLGAKFAERPSTISQGSQGGNFAPGSYFRGPAAFFGGIQFESPWNTTFKLEYDGNNYKNEPLTESTVISQKSPINIGLTYHLASFVDLSLGFERGNTLSIGLAMSTDLSSLSVPKLFDKPTPALNIVRPKSEPDWTKTAQDIHDLTEWEIDQIHEEQNKVILEASFTDAPYRRARLDKAMSVINRDAPEQIDQVEIEHKSANQIIAVEKINRDAWVLSQNEPPRNDEYFDPVSISYDITPPKSKGQLPSSVGSHIDLNPDLDFIYNWQSANGFLLYELDLSENLNIRLPYNFYVKGKERARITDNYKNWVVDPYSLLPHVRTEGRLYKTSKEFTMTNLSLIQANHIQENWYAAAYTGYFEEEYGGVGGEVMYRPGGSSLATSVDWNHVKKRAYDQNFDFLNYQVNTGHFNFYWRTPLDGVLLQLNYGQFLAGDRGTKYSVRKEFPNGVAMSAYITRTNVPASIFGEGSFDKGIQFDIPFDAFLASSSHTWATFFWQPLTRDGGQMVIRPVNLYLDTSSWAAPYNSFFKPAPLANDEVPPDERIEKNN